MKRITKESIQQDLKTIEDLWKKYSEEFHEEHREDRPGHLFNQLPLIRKAVSNTELGLWVAMNSLRQLEQLKDCIIEDEVERTPEI